MLVDGGRLWMVKWNAMVCDKSLRRCLSGNAANDACKRFDLKRQAEAYLGWYEELAGR